MEDVIPVDSFFNSSSAVVDTNGTTTLSVTSVESPHNLVRGCIPHILNLTATLDTILKEHSGPYRNAGIGGLKVVPGLASQCLLLSSR